MSVKVKGFEPVFDENSVLLILGSFPSGKSRVIQFYYGNKQNRFWRVLCSHFGEDIPESVTGKRDFLLKHRIALWDIVTECEIDGSKDDSIKNFTVADIKTLLQNSDIKYIILNGSKAYSIFKEYFGNIEITHTKLPSTSPANTRFDEKEWHDAISSAFGNT